MATELPDLDWRRELIVFVTGRLAEPIVRETAASVSEEYGFRYEVQVLGVSVAALMHANLVRRRLQLPTECTRVVLPGWCEGDLSELERRFGVPFHSGPKHIEDLPEFFGGEKEPPELDRHRIEILAEINHAPRNSLEENLRLAHAYRRDGADLIDVGCVPGESWSGVGRLMRALRTEGHRVSIDSFDRAEVEAAVEGGAELLLSCRSENVDWVRRLGIEVVVIPDDHHDLSSWNRTIEVLESEDVEFRLDPILEPLGVGFVASLQRYAKTRELFPDREIMMGIGNVTELVEADSAALNLMLAMCCEELRVGSVLTTQVINWARTAVKEFALARRVAMYCTERGTIPKHLTSDLLCLRDPKLHDKSSEAIERIAQTIQDPNFRIFAEAGKLHMMNREGHWTGTDPFLLFERMISETEGDIDSSHAFYLGYEMHKALTALTLGKQYVQDRALRWGFLTEEEQSFLERKRKRGQSSGTGGRDEA